MSKLVRFGVSLEDELLAKFDKHIESKNYTNRSEALRDLIRQELVKKEWQGDIDVAGAITIIYDHHVRDLVSRLTEIQHDFQNVIISTQHIHIDHDNCLEIIAVRGNARSVEHLGDVLKSVKGVKHSTLSMTSTGREIK